MSKMMMKNELTAIRETESRISEQSAAIHRRIAALRAKLDATEAKITENSSLAAAAQDALKAAMLADDPEAIAAARAKGASAAKQTAEVGALTMEAQALQSAIASVETELSALAEQSAALAPKVNALRLAALDDMAAPLAGELNGAIRYVMAIYAKAKALSEQAQATDPSVGAGRYGPALVEPLRLINVGADRATTGSLYAVASVADQIADARAQVADMLRRMGF